MPKILFFISSIVSALWLVSGCATPKNTIDYTNFKKHEPRSILVLMPTSMANNVTAGPAVLATSITPLTESGYYVFSPSMVYDTFKYNGVTDAQEIHNIPLAKIYEVFGADAVLYINISEYASKYAVLSSYFTVAVNARLVDAQSGDLLWQGGLKTDYSQSSGNSLLEMLVSSLVAKIVSELSDQGYEATKVHNFNLYNPGARIDPILYGPYHPKHQEQFK